MRCLLFVYAAMAARKVMYLDDLRAMIYLQGHCEIIEKGVMSE